MAKKIYMYGPIGSSWWDETATSAADFVKQLDEIGGEDIDIFVNSSGGDVFDGYAIYSAIARYEGKVTVHVDGLAASAASYCILSADEVLMSPSALMMIHKAWVFANGNADDLRNTAETLDKLDADIVGIYAKKTCKQRDEILEMMEAETWLTADEAVDMGFADGLCEQFAAEACVDRRMLSAFKNAPASIARACGDGSDERNDDGDTEQDPACNPGEIIENDEPEDGDAPFEPAGLAYELVNGKIYKVKE